MTPTASTRFNKYILVSQVTLGSGTDFELKELVTSDCYQEITVTQCAQLLSILEKINKMASNYCRKLVEGSLEAEFDSAHDGENNI